MYIEKLYIWKTKDWEDFFSQFPDLSKDQKIKVKQFLTLSTKTGIESHFDYLKDAGIINGIGPGYLMKCTRKIVSWLFKGVKYEWHDIMYAIGGTESDRLSADAGLLKYSKMSVCLYIINSTSQISPITAPFSYMAGFIQLILAYFCYVSVVIFGRFGSFRYINK